MSRLSSDETHSDQFNLAPWMIFFAFDTVCRIAFSDDQGMMEKQADMGKTLEGARHRFAYWHSWQSLPWLERLLYKNKWAVQRTARSSNKGSLLGQLAGARLQDRLQNGGLGTNSDLLDRFLQGAEREPGVITPATVHGLVISVVSHTIVPINSTSPLTTEHRSTQVPKLPLQL